MGQGAQNTYRRNCPGLVGHRSLSPTLLYLRQLTLTIERAIGLMFAVVAGVNMTGYRTLPTGTDGRSISTRKQRTIERKTDKLFGSKGTSAAADRLRKIPQRNEVRDMKRRSRKGVSHRR